MRPLIVKSASRIKGTVSPPGDKAIAHRAVIISALAPQKTEITNFPFNKDCLSTVTALRKLGIKIILKRPDRVIIFGRGLWGLEKPKGPIFAASSGTTLRLILGVLAGQDFVVKLSAGKSLSQRPMLRVATPLRKMGAKIQARRTTRQQAQREEYPPITIRGGNLKGITYKIPVASAQVKSAILLAGLYAKGTTRVIESIKTRDHTERMLKLFQAKIKVASKQITIKGVKELVSPQKITVPGDISSVSFFMVLASILPGSHILLKDVGLNPSRSGIIKVLKRMGASIKVTKSPRHHVTGNEPMGDIIIKSSQLKGAVIKKEEIPSLIDELPVLMVAASCAAGKSVFQGAGELRVKETDRIKSMTENLKAMGAAVNLIKIKGLEHIVIQGVRNLRAAEVRTFGDHRTAMSMFVAGLVAGGATRIDDFSCIDKSFPDFLRLLRPLIKY